MMSKQNTTQNSQEMDGDSRNQEERKKQAQSVRQGSRTEIHEAEQETLGANDSQGWQGVDHEQQFSNPSEKPHSYTHEEERAEYPQPQIQGTDEIGTIIAQQVEMFSENANQTADQIEMKELSIQDSILHDENETAALQHSKQMTDQLVINELERLVVNLNHVAMEFLRNDQFQMAIALLQRAETNLLQVDDSITQLQESVVNEQNSLYDQSGMSKLNELKNRLLGLTFNNLGCVAKQQQDYKQALEYLKKALIYESAQEEANLRIIKKRAASLTKSSDADPQLDFIKLQQEQYITCNTSGTILNICAILSKLKKHKQAYEYAMQAITNLKKSMDLMRIQIAKTKNMQKDNKDVQLNSSLVVHEKNLYSQWVNIATTTVIAYYNAAVESEFTCQWKEALELYQEALYLSMRSMNANNPMTPKIQQAILKVKIKVRNKVQLPCPKPKKSQTGSIIRGKISSQHTKSVTARAAIKGGLSAELGSVIAVQESNISSKQYFNTRAIVKTERNHKVFSGEAKLVQTQDSLMSDVEQQYTDNEEQQPSKVNLNDMKFYGNSEAINIKQTSMFNSKNNKPQSYEDPSLQSKRREQSIVGKTSPMSLKQIIDKLEKDQSKDSQSITFQRNNRTVQTFNNAMDKSQLTNRPVKHATANNWARKNTDSLIGNRRASQMPSTRIKKTQGAENYYNNIEIDTGLAPSIFPQIGMPPKTASIEQVRHKTAISGLRTAGNAQYRISFPQSITQRQTNTNYNKRRQRGSQQPYTVPDTTENYSGERQVETIKSLSNKSEFAKLSHSRKTAQTNRDLAIPLQVVLSQEQDKRQRYLEEVQLQEKRKHNREITRLTDHFTKQTDQIMSGEDRLSSITCESNDKQSHFRRQYEQVTKQIAASVYLPEKLKKAVQKEQQKRTIQRAIKIKDELMEKNYKLRLNQKLEQTFQEEIAKWKSEQDLVMEEKIRKYEQEMMIKEEAERKERIEFLEIHSQREMQARKEIDRLAEYANSIESNRQEIEKQLKEKELALQIGIEMLSLVKTFSDDNRIPQPVRKEESTQVNQRTSTQGLDQPKQNQTTEVQTHKIQSMHSDTQTEQRYKRVKTTVDQKTSTKGLAYNDDQPYFQMIQTGQTLIEEQSNQSLQRQTVQSNQSIPDAYSATAQTNSINSKRESQFKILEDQQPEVVETQSRNDSSQQKNSTVQSRIETCQSSLNMQAPQVVNQTLANTQQESLNARYPKESYEIEKPIIIKEVFGFHTNIRSYNKSQEQNKDQVVQSSQAMSDLISKINPQTEENPSQFWIEESNILSERPNRVQRQCSSIQSVSEDQEKQTITNVTQVRQSVQEYGADLFHDISMVGEEDISQWQQKNQVDRINEIEDDDSVAHTEITQVKERPSQLGDGPIFIQRRTSYRAKDDSRDGSRMTVTQNKYKTSIQHEKYERKVAMHELTERPPKQSSLVPKKQQTHQIDYASTVKHSSVKNPFEKPLERVNTQPQNIQIIAKQITQNKEMNEERKSQQTNQTATGNYMKVNELVMQSRSEVSEITQHVIHNKKDQIVDYKSNSMSVYTNVQPILQGNIKQQQTRYKVPEREDRFQNAKAYQTKPADDDYCLENRQYYKSSMAATDPRFVKIAGQIQKLNLQLEQFQTELELNMADPLLKSTRRSNHLHQADESKTNIIASPSIRLQQTEIQSIDSRNNTTQKVSVHGRGRHLNTSQFNSSQASQSTLPKQIHRPQVTDYKESAELTEEVESIEDVLSQENNLSQATHITKTQRVQTQKNAI